MAKTHAIEFFHELDDVAGCAATARHAAPQAFAGRDDQVRGFPVVVERTQADPVRAMLLERHAPRLDQGDEIGFAFDPVDFGVGDAGHGFG